MLPYFVSKVEELNELQSELEALIKDKEIAEKIVEESQGKIAQADIEKRKIEKEIDELRDKVGTRAEKMEKAAEQISEIISVSCGFCRA